MTLPIRRRTPEEREQYLMDKVVELVVGQRTLRQVGWLGPYGLIGLDAYQQPGQVYEPVYVQI